MVEVVRVTLLLTLYVVACGAAEQIPSATQPFATVVATSDVAAAALVVDAKNVYWTTSASLSTPHPTVLQCPKTGCVTATVLESAAASRQWIAVDATSVDWITNEGSAVARCTIGGCGAPTAVPYLNVWDIATASPGAVWNAGSYVIDRTDVYWVDGRDILTCPIGGCSSGGMLVARGVLTDTGVGPQIAVDAVALYWHDLEGDIVRCPKVGCTTPTIVAQLPGITVSAIASDGAHVYWVAQGSIVRAPVDGGSAPTVVFSGGVSRIALDTDAIYFTAGNDVMKLAK